MEMNQYLSIFIEEANDHLQALNENMLKLEQQPEDISIVQVIFRSAHTLKGMSATMGYEDLSSIDRMRWRMYWTLCATTSSV